MRVPATTTIQTEIEVSLDEFDDKDIVAYLRDIGYEVDALDPVVNAIHRLMDAYIYDQKNFDRVFKDITYGITGRIVP